MQSTSSMDEIEVPPNTPTSANLEPNIVQKTPSFADIENELIKEAKVEPLEIRGDVEDDIKEDLDDPLNMEGKYSPYWKLSFLSCFTT